MGIYYVAIIKECRITNTNRGRKTKAGQMC